MGKPEESTIRLTQKYLHRPKGPLQTKLSARNTTKAINTYAISVLTQRHREVPAVREGAISPAHVTDTTRKSKT